MTGVQTCALPIYLTGSDLTRANLAGADLTDADLRRASGVNLEGAIGTPAFMPDDPLGE